MELISNVDKNNLFTELVNKVCPETKKGTFTLRANEVTDDVWEEIVKNNLNPKSPCLVYFIDSPTDNQVEVKVVCKTA